MKTNLPFSIIVPWYGGNSVREKSLQNMFLCIEKQEMPASKEELTKEIIVVEQENGSSIPSLPLRYKHIVLSAPGKPFNKSWCMNVGAREAQYKNMLFIDADSLFGNDYFNSIKGFIRSTVGQSRDLFMAWNYLIAMPGKDNPHPRWIRPDMTRALGGIWHCHNYTYFNIFGGMNESYFGYGGEDNDAYERACAALKTPHIAYMMYPLAHQYHDWVVPNPDAVKYFEVTRKNPTQVTERLMHANIGDRFEPHPIGMDDLL